MFLERLAEQYPEHLNIIQLDNGRFHYGSNLKIPSGHCIDIPTTIQPRIESN